MKGDTVGNAVIKVDNMSGDRYNTNATITGRGNDIAADRFIRSKKAKTILH
jgi:hypothetical protein